MLCLEVQMGKDGHRDAYDPRGKRIIEVKGSGSSKKDLSSLCQSETFSELVFVKIDKDNDEAYIYETGVDSTVLKSIMVNKTESVGMQQAAGKTSFQL